MADPSTISGLVVRYRADDITGVADGGAVASWPARVGNQPLTQATAASQPTYVAAGVNGLPAVRWPSATNSVFMTATGLASFSQPATVIFVLKNTTATASIHAFTWNNELQINAPRWYLYAGANLVEPTDATANAWQVVSAALNGSTSAIFHNGTQAVTGNAGTQGFTGTFHLGQRGDGQRRFQGDIAEVLIFNRVLTATERGSVHSYVQDRYGITVADYSGGTGPTAAGYAGSGTLSTTGQPAPTAAAGYGGTGSLTSTGTPTVSSATSYAGTGTLTATGTSSTTAAVSYSGSGALAATTAPSSSGSASYAGSGALAATGRPSTSAGATYSGAGALASTGGSAGGGTITYSGSGSLAAGGAIAVGSAVTYSGSGSLAAASSSSSSSTAAYASTGTLTSSGRPAFASTVTYTGDGVLTSTARPALVGSASYSGSGALTSIPGTTAHLRWAGAVVRAVYWQGERVRSIAYRGTRYPV